MTLLLAAAFIAPVAGSQAPLPPTPLDPLLAGPVANVTSSREAVLGPALTREDIDVQLDMEFRDVDFDTVNVIFGGGKFSATARITARIDLRVLAASRVSDAVEAALPGAGNVTGPATREQYIPADIFRSSLAGEALAAFQGEQESRLADYIRKTIPNVTVLNAQFEWTNVSPEESYETRGTSPAGNEPGDFRPEDFNDPTLPPITLRATVDVQYLERASLIGILEKALAKPKSEREKAQEEQVADAQAAYDRSAFGLLGIRQVLDLQAPEGWNLVVRVKLPEGFTFEEASPDVALAPNLREANVLTLGRDANADVLNPVALTLSNRFIVSMAMLAGILLVGTLLRFPVLLAVNGIRRRLRT